VSEGAGQRVETLADLRREHVDRGARSPAVAALLEADAERVLGSVRPVSTRSLLYNLARFLGDMQAVKRGRVSRRLVSLS
jgi:hypothetical protein